MKLKVEQDKLTLLQEQNINAGAINYYIIDVEFSKEWDNLSKKIVYVKNNGDVVEQSIVDGQTVVPFQERGTYCIGIIGYLEENNVKTKQISTNLLYCTFNTGSGEYTANTEITEQELSTYEQYLAKITAKSEEIKEDIKTIGELKTEIKEKQDDFNANADKKLNDFNDNYVEKKELIDKVYKDTVEVKENAEKEIQDGLDNYNTNAEQKQQEIQELADGVKDFTTAIQFATFEVDNDMNLLINTADKLKNTSFEYNKETGELEVEING